MQLRLEAVLDNVEENVLYGYEEVLLDPAVGFRSVFRESRVSES